MPCAFATLNAPKTFAWLQGDRVPGLPESHDMGLAGMLCGCGGAGRRRQVQCGPRAELEGRRLRATTDGILAVILVPRMVPMRL